VLKRWAAWPQGIWWLAGIAAVVLGLAFVWLLFVPIADWLAHHDVGSVRGSLHEAALDNARGRLLTLLAGLLAAGALPFTALNFLELGSRANSARIDERLRHLARLLGRYKDVQAAAGFLDQYKDLYLRTAAR
jgi:hypothetical protein